MPVGTGHAGDISPSEAMHKLESGEGAVLVDVRTVAEWETIGVPDLAKLADEPVFLEWASAPSMMQNPEFARQLEAELARRGAGPETPLLFLCRSGARSDAAARTMAALGHSRSFNIAGGFEGSPARELPGWKGSGLPWTGP